MIRRFLDILAFFPPAQRKQILYEITLLLNKIYPEKEMKQLQQKQQDVKKYWKQLKGDE